MPESTVTALHATRGEQRIDVPQDMPSVEEYYSSICDLQVRCFEAQSAKTAPPKAGVRGRSPRRPTSRWESGLTSCTFQLSPPAAPRRRQLAPTAAADSESAQQSQTTLATSISPIWEVADYQPAAARRQATVSLSHAFALCRLSDDEGEYLPAWPVRTEIPPCHFNASDRRVRLDEP